MSLRKKFGTDKSAIEEGVWIDIVENEDDTTCRFRIKRMNQQNPKYLKQMANHRKAFEGDNFSGKKLSQMQASMIEVLVNTVIVGWEYLEDWTQPTLTSGGFPVEQTETKYLEFSVDNARMTLLEFPDLLDVITAEASEITNFQAKEREVKN